MQDDLRKFSQAVIQGATQSGPASYIPALSAYFRAPMAANLFAPAQNAQAGIGGQMADDEAKAEEAARQASIQKLKDSIDPSKFSRVRKQDGGFDFYDPSGKKISIGKYSAVTGQSQADILKDSDNPIDQEYVQDYSNMHDLVQASNNRDGATVQAFINDNPDLKKYIKTDNPNNPTQITDMSDLMRLLVKKYPHVYGVGGYGETVNNRNMRIYGESGTGGAAGTNL